MKKTVLFALIVLGLGFTIAQSASAFSYEDEDGCRVRITRRGDVIRFCPERPYWNE